MHLEPKKKSFGVPTTDIVGHSSHSITIQNTPRFLTILSPYPKVSQWHHFWSDPWIPRWRPAWRRAARAAGASSASCAVRTPSAWPPAAMITGIPWNLRRAARTGRAMGEKKHPWSPKTSRNRMGFRLNMGFFQVAVGAFFCGFLSEFCFFFCLATCMLVEGWWFLCILANLGCLKLFRLIILRRLLIKSSSHLVESQFWLPQSTTTVSSSKQTVGYPQSQILNVSGLTVVFY